MIARMPNGKYRFGAPWSSGQQASVRDLENSAPRPEGKDDVTAAIHTHPRAGGLPGGGDRAFAWRRYPDEQGIGGYGGAGDVQAGDLVYGYGYFHRINVYIADSAGLHFWDYNEYVRIQEHDAFRAVPLKQAYKAGL